MDLTKLIKQLGAKDEADREEAWGALHKKLVAGKWPATLPAAVTQLLDALPRTRDARNLVLALVADVVAQDHVRAWLAPLDEKPTSVAAKTHAVVLARLKEVLALVASRERRERTAAALLLSVLPEARGDTLPALRRRIEEDPDEAARASALLAAARLADGDASVMAQVATHRKTDKSGLVRGAATIAELQADAGIAFSKDLDGLGAWLAWEPNGELLWFEAARMEPLYRGLGFSEAPALALLALARSRGERAQRDLEEVVSAVARGSTSPAVPTQSAKVLLDLGGFDRNATQVGLPRELTADQARVARLLAGSSGVYEAAYGLPAAGTVRRRWIGLEPPGPLEREVKVGVRGQPPLLPIWRAWIALQNSGKRGQPVPVELEPSLSVHDRWEALVELSALDYGQGTQVNDQELEDELRRVEFDAELGKRAARIAQDLVARAEAADRAGRSYALPAHASLLLLLPFVRAKKALPASCEHLVPIGGAPLAREVLAALPEDRRVQAVLRFLREARGGGTADRLRRALEVSDLAFSAEIAGAIEEKLPTIKIARVASEVATRLRERLAKG